MLVNVDGRSASARRFRDLVHSFEADIGGNLSEAERGLIRQAAALQLRAEQMQSALVRGEPVNDDDLVRVAGAAKRLLGTLRTKAEKKQPPAPNLTDLLHRKASEKAGSK